MKLSTIQISTCKRASFQCRSLLPRTQKENCPDAIKQFGRYITLHDPRADPVEVKQDYELDIVTELNNDDIFDNIIIAVAHQQFCNLILINTKLPIASSAIQRPALTTAWQVQGANTRGLWSSADDHYTTPIPPHPKHQFEFILKFSISLPESHKKPHIFSEKASHHFRLLSFLF
jgi:hypothetical protein